MKVRLRDACLGLGVKRETLLKLFEQHNGEFIKKVGHSRVQGTYNRYRTIYRHLCEFVPKVYRRDDIPLKELNLTFINNFEYFLRTEKKCRTNTVWGYMIGLKHVISIARNSGALPFRQILGAVKTEFEKFGSGLQSMQRHLNQTGNDLEELIGTRSRAITRKLESVQQLEPTEAADLLGLAEGGSRISTQNSEIDRQDNAPRLRRKDDAGMPM